VNLIWEDNYELWEFDLNRLLLTLPSLYKSVSGDLIRIYSADTRLNGLLFRHFYICALLILSPVGFIWITYGYNF